MGSRPLRGTSRLPGLDLGLHPRPHLWPELRLLSPQGRACPPPPQTGFSALLGSVGTSPLDSPFLFSWGFIWRGGQRGGFLPVPRQRAPGLLPRGGLGCPLWQEVGPGAPAWRCMRPGCALSRACRDGLRPSPSRSGPDSRRSAHNGPAQALADAAWVWSRGGQGLHQPLGGRAHRRAGRVASLLCDLGKLIRLLWATFLFFPLCKIKRTAKMRCWGHSCRAFKR